MQETDKTNISYKIKIQFFTRLGLVFLDVANRALVFFNLKNSERFWGIVYDSVSKQPLDPVIVQLVYVDGREVESCFTDLGGRYGFLARKGKFKILARKSNYIFPSRLVAEGRDGIYENLYHSEFFVLKNDDEVIAPNIPMDPENFDWNQKAKQQVLFTYPHWKWFFRRLFGVLFWCGFIFSLFELWLVYPSPGGWLYFILGVYILAIFLAAILPEARLWGKIIFDSRGENLILVLHNAQFPAVSFGRAKVHENGKFLLRANKGSYLLSVFWLDSKNRENLLGSTKVKIGSSGVFNDTIVVKS